MFPVPISNFTVLTALPARWSQLQWEYEAYHWRPTEGALQTNYGTDGERIRSHSHCGLACRRGELNNPNRASLTVLLSPPLNSLSPHMIQEKREPEYHVTAVSLRRPRILLRWQPLQTWRCSAGTETCGPLQGVGVQSRRRWRPLPVPTPTWPIGIR